MRILFFHPLTGYLWRGIERNVISLASVLPELGHETSILSVNHPQRALLSDLDPRVACYEVPYSRYYSYEFAVPFFAAHLVRREYDAIIVFFGGFGVGASLALAHRFRSLRTYLYLGYPVEVAPHRYDELDRWKIPGRATEIWGHGEHVAVQAEARWGRTVATLPTGVDTDRFHSDPDIRRSTREKLGVEPDTPVILTVSALDERKGIQHILDALPRVVASVPNARYLIAGDGDFGPELRRLVRERGLEKEVIMLGTTERVENLYAAADVFCLLARGEAGPNVIYEALSAEVPVVTLSAPHLEQQLPAECVEFVPDTDPDRTARALIELLWDAERRGRMMRAGRALVVEQFSFRRLGSEIADLISSSDHTPTDQRLVRSGHD